MKFTTCFGLRSQTTRLQASGIPGRVPPQQALHLLWNPSQGRFEVGAPQGARRLYATVRRAQGSEIQRWTDPSSLAVTTGILVSFFSSAY
jgi:hypothetical protein